MSKSSGARFAPSVGPRRAKKRGVRTIFSVSVSTMLLASLAFAGFTTGALGAESDDSQQQADALAAAVVSGEPTIESSTDAAALPAATDEPATQETAPATPESASSQEPAVTEEPTVTDEPAVTAEPTVTDDSAPAMASAVVKPAALEADQGLIQPFAIGPDGGTPPFVSWTVKDAAGNLIPGATFKFEYRGRSGWSTGSDAGAISDCDGTCSTSTAGNSLDRDSEGGEFLLEHFRTSRDSGNRITADSRYRVEPVTAPAGYRWIDTDRREVASNGWTGDTHDFGTFVVGAIPTAPQCSAGYVYGISGDGQIQQISPDGTVTDLGSSASSVSSFNGLGIGSGGSPVYGYERSNSNNNNVSVATIYTYDTATGTWASTGHTLDSNNNSRTVQFVAGGVNLQTGQYFLGGFNSNGTQFRLWQYNAANNTTTYKGYINTDTGTSNSTNNGDLAFDSAGNLFVVRGRGSVTTVFSVTSANLTAANGGLIPSAGSNDVTTTSNVNGVAFDSSGEAFLGSSGTITSFNMPDWSDPSTVVNSGLSSTDLATCSSPPTITIEKFIEGGRVNATDQFTMTLRQGSQTIGTATTTGTAIALQGERVGPLPTVRNVALSFSEVGAGSTNLANYVSSYRCYVDGVQDHSASGNGTSGTITIPIGGEAVLCTFYNSPLIANVTIHKDVTDLAGNNPAPRQGWTVGATVAATTGTAVVTPAAGTQQTNASGDANWQVRFGAYDHRATVNVSETIEATHDFVSGECTVTHLDGSTSNTTLSGPAAQALAGIEPGDQVDCTYVNRPVSSSLVVEKNWVINGTSYTNDAAQSVLQTWGASAAPVVSPLPTGQTASFGANLAPYTLGTVVNVNETVSAGQFCAVDSKQYRIGTGADAPLTAAGADVTLVRGENVVTLTNTLSCGTTLTLNKTVINDDGGSATADQWTLSAAGTTPLTGPSGTTSATMTPGTYTLSEGSGPANYDWTALSCVDASGTAIAGTSLASPTVSLAIGDDVTCTFTNDDVAPELKLNKTVAGAPQSYAQNWTLTATGEGVALSGAGGTADFAQVPGNTPITLAETRNTTLPALAEFTDGAVWQCVDVANSSADVPLTDNQISLTSGQRVECTIINTFNGVTPTITKTAATPTHNTDGSWTISYTVTVENPSDVVGVTYDVVDALAFGGDITVVDAEATGPGARGEWDGTTDTLVASGQILAAGSDPAVYTVTVDATIAAGATDEPTNTLECAADPSTRTAGGFLNTADLIVAGETIDDVEACVAPAFPTVTKNAANAAQQADGSWDVVYTITVANTSGVALTYDLSDTLGWDTDLAAGITSATATGPAGAITDWNGVGNTTLATAAQVAASSSDVYTVTVNVLVPVTATAADVECAPTPVAGSGTFNSATLTSSGQQSSDDDCTNIPVGAVEVAKDLVSAANQADGSWQVSYEITVTNNSDAATTYDLSDTLAFGGGIDVESATWERSGGTPSGEWVLPNTTATLATGALIAPGATHTYNVLATASIDPLGDTPAALECTGVQGTDGGGFLNTAEITFPGGSDDASACGEPAVPTFDKTAEGATQQADGSWDVVYTLTATNDSDLDVYYDLSDTLGFDSELVINNATAIGPDGQRILWTGIIVTSLANDELLPAGTDHVYTITVNVTVPTTAGSDVVECSAVPSAGSGTFNSATLTSSGQEIDDSDCVEIPLPNVQIAKTVTDLSQRADGQWVVVYGIDVTNPGTVATTYDLSDTLDFGAGLTPVTAEWSQQGGTATGAWTLPGATAELADGALIAAGATHSYEVTVVASVAGGTTLPAASECSGTEGIDGGGFLNTAEVTFPGGTDEDADCAQPTVPTVDKSFDSASQNADSTWTVNYTITVDNRQGLDSHYSLADAPAFPAGVEVLGWSVAAGTGTPAPSPAIDGDWTSPGTIATGVAIGAGTQHTYTVAFEVSVPASLPSAVTECSEAGAGNGFFNQATLTSGDQVREDDACGPIEEVGTPTITKTVTGTSQNADGTWGITYDVVVTSNADFVTNYALSDTIRFGAGATVNSAAWTWANAPEGSAAADVAGTWATPVADNLTATIATARVLPAHGTGDPISHTYTVTVNASVPLGTIGTTAMDCTLDEGETGTGFLNEASITSGGLTATADDCATPSVPVITKDGASASQAADGTWNVTYDLTVANTGGHATVYDLTDTPAFAAGVTINNWTVAAGAGTPTVAINAAPFTDGAIAAGRDLAAGATHTYEVTFNVSVAVTAVTETLECSTQGGGAGSGFFNTAELTIGDDALVDDDCTDIPAQGTPSVAKTLGTVTQGTDGKWTITYTVSVTGHATQVTRYDLVDTLAFGAGTTVESAAWTWDDAPTGAAANGAWDLATSATATLAVGRVLPATAADTYTVTVVADVAEGVIGSAAGQCGNGTEQDPASGFLNQVQLLVDGSVVDSDDACGEPAAPSFTKTGVGITDNGDGTFDAVYTLTVTSGATDGQDVVYNLTDTPALPAQVELVDRKVTSSDATVNAAWDGADSTDDVVASAQVIGQDEVDTFTVTLTIRITEAMIEAQRECEPVEGGQAGGLLNSGQVTSGNDSYPGSDCIDIPDPTFTVDKSVASAVQLASGQWQVVYTIEVSNTSNLPGSYALSDTLDYGAGLTPTSANWALDGGANGAWDLTAGDTTVLSDHDAALAAGGTHTYTVTVLATVAAGTSLPATAECSGTDGGGFLNTVELTFPGGTDEDAACAEPTVPEVAKTFGDLAQNADGTWTATYRIGVDNSDGKDSFYSLADQPQFQADVTVVDWTVTAADGTPAVTPAIDGAVWAAPGTIATDVAIPAGAIHAYDVAFRITIPAGIETATGECSTSTDGGGSGLFNGATLTSGEQVREDDDCSDLPEIGIPSVDKTVTSTVQNADGTWTISYAIIVTSDADHAATYALEDTISFGGAANVTAASWTWTNAPVGTSAEDLGGTWTTPVSENLTADITNGRLIAAGSDDDAVRHLYLVTVTAEVPQAAIGTAALDCELSEGEDGTGFLNSTTLTSGLLEDSSEDCSVPTTPTIAKHDATVAPQLADGTWNVSYEITVDNTGGHRSVYNLTDIPGFATGVAINNWTVVAGADTPALDPAVDGAFTDGVITTARTLPADAVHVYTVTFNVDVAVTTQDSALECAVEGGVAGSGFFNTAELTIGDDSLVDDDCTDIPAPGTPTVAKTLGTVTQGEDGKWTITYDVTVTGHAEQVTRYTLDDTLAFGGDASIENADWSWDDAPEGASTDLAGGTWVTPVAENTTTRIATERVLPAGAVDNYTVRVVADVAAGAVGTAAMECSEDSTQEGSSGFLNQVELLLGDTVVDSDEACGEPAGLEFTKTGVGVSSNGDGTFDAVYTLTVTSNATDGQVLTYSLTDTPAIPAGVELVDRVATSTDGITDAAWNGADSLIDVVATSQTLEAGLTHVYTVTLTVRVTEPLTVADRECEAVEGGESGGLLNAGAVTSGNDETTSEDCLTLPDPDFSVEKNTVGVTETEVGTWQVTYEVTVANTSEVPGTYSLSDTLAYGEGITPTAASWSQGELAGEWDLAEGPSTVLATDAVLAAGESHVYTVTVLASVPAAAVGTTVADCVVDEGEAGTGFLNTVTLGWDDETRTDEACGEPHVNLGGLEISKTVTGEVDAFNGGDEALFTISWVCTTRTGGSLSGEVVLANGETRLVSDEIPLGATCVVTEEMPNDDSLDELHFWEVPAYTAAEVTLSVAEPVAAIGVINEVEKEEILPEANPTPTPTPSPTPAPTPTERPKPGLPSSGGPGASHTALLVLLTTGLAAGIAWRRRRGN